MTKPTRPEPLATDRYIATEERREYDRQLALFIQSQRPKQSAPKEPEAQKKSTDETFEDLYKSRWQQEQARQKEREAAEAAQAQADDSYMNSSPAVAEIMANNPYDLLTKIVYWSNRGYSLADDGIKFFTPNLYHVHLTAPVTTRKTKQS